MKTLDELFQDFILFKVDMADNTAQQYQICINQFNHWAGRVLTVEDLNADFILSFMRYRKSIGKAPRTVNNARQILITLWKHAFRKKLTELHPAETYDLPKLKVVKTLPEAWSLPELNRILHSCDNARPLPYWDHLHWRALVLTLYDTAHRLEAILLCEVSDIQNGFLTARKTKQDRETVHKLHADTLAAIEKLPEPANGLLFPWPFKRRQIWREFGKLLKKAGLSSTRRDKFHKLRRTSATHLAAVAGMEAAEDHLDHKTHGLARSTYVDPRFLPTIKAADVLPRP